MIKYDSIATYPELIQILEHIDERIAEASCPPDQIIWSNKKLCKELEVSPRTAAYWRSKGKITYIKVDGLVYYRKSDVLEFLLQYQIKSKTRKLRIK